jgi:hypothetical protein
MVYNVSCDFVVNRIKYYVDCQYNKKPGTFAPGFSILISQFSIL